MSDSSVLPPPGELDYSLKNVFATYHIVPRTWSEIICRMEQRLNSADFERFKKLHQYFVEYPAESTLRSFYDFIFKQGLQYEIAAQRYYRLLNIWKMLLPAIFKILSDSPARRADEPNPCTLLDVGCGACLFLEALQLQFSAVGFYAYDICEQIRLHAKQKGFSLLEEDRLIKPNSAENFDCILCIDSLGEIHCDEDSLLLEPNDPERTKQLLEERYAFTEQLVNWSRLLSNRGKLFFCEPLKRASLFKALKEMIQNQGLDCEYLDHEENPLGLVISHPSA